MREGIHQEYMSEGGREYSSTCICAREGGSTRVKERGRGREGVLYMSEGGVKSGQLPPCQIEIYLHCDSY